MFFLTLPGWSRDGLYLVKDPLSPEPRLFRTEPRELTDPFNGEKCNAPVLIMRGEILVGPEIPPDYQRLPLIQVRRSPRGAAGFEVDPRTRRDCDSSVEAAPGVG